MTTPNSQVDEERKLFEEWFAKEYPEDVASIAMYEAGAPNTVLTSLVPRHKKSNTWQCWQARAQLSASPPASDSITIPISEYAGFELWKKEYLPKKYREEELAKALDKARSAT